jgi:hypothetical protein
MGYTVEYKGKQITWTPLEGLDTSLSDKSLEVGAKRWAFLISIGKPERVAHQEAEKAAYEHYYFVTYKVYA